MVHLVRDVPGLGIRRDHHRWQPHAELAEVLGELRSWRTGHRRRDVIEETAALVGSEDESRTGPQRAGGYGEIHASHPGSRELDVIGRMVVMPARSVDEGHARQ